MATVNIKPTTRLQNTIGHSEARVIAKSFGEKFDVDMTEFRLEQYFGPVEFMQPLGYMLLLLFFRKKYSFLPLTPQDFYNAAKIKRWTAPR